MSTEQYYYCIPNKEQYIKNMNFKQLQKSDKYAFSNSFGQRFFPHIPIRHERNEEDYDKSNQKFLRNLNYRK